MVSKILWCSTSQPQSALVAAFVPPQQRIIDLDWRVGVDSKCPARWTREQDTYFLAGATATPSMDLRLDMNDVNPTIVLDVNTAPERPGIHDDFTLPPYGALSMGIEELETYLGGRGRARLVWDCYNLGIDAALYFATPENVTKTEKSYSYPRNSADTAGSSEPHIDLELDAPSKVFDLLPSCRRLNKLGKSALDRLASLYSGYQSATGRSPSVEGGVGSLSHISQSSDGTIKLLLRLVDDSEIETVIIPWYGMQNRSTLCVSTQVGCAQACRFCATGKMSKIRSLTSDEILVQLFFAKKIVRQLQGKPPPDSTPQTLDGVPPPPPSISNIVFMGMGDSADNVQAVQRACEIMTTRELFQLSATKVVVSTVGPTPESFMSFSNNVPCVLAWSVHAVRDATRKRLVPTTKFPMTELQQGFINALRNKPMKLRTAMLEYVLLANVNDSFDDATELAAFSRQIVEQVPGCKLMVNLIPYNDIGDAPSASKNSDRAFGLPYQKPSPQSVRVFQQQLWNCGVCAHVRTTRGDDENAACGQLATMRRKAGRAA
jgi:23S rRNA (adenine2503-C2)-methyltransferase